MFNRDRLVLLLPWCIALVLAGCGQSPAETGTTRTTAESDADGSYHGLVSIEEQILWDDVVARVRLISVDGAVVVEPGGTYRGALEFRFRVLEYIKGNGGAEVVAVTIDEGRYDTASAARAAVPGMVATRDTLWDGREAIVFLLDYHDQNGRTTYLLGGHTVYGEDGYTVASRHDKRWLPEAATTTVTGARSTDAAEKRFLLDAPSNVGAQGSSSRSVAPPSQTGSAPTITLGAFKARVAELEAEVAAGDGSEEYRNCVFLKYSRQRSLEWTAANGRLPHRATAYDLGSGLPAGSFVHEAYNAGIPGRPGTYWLEGRDKDLFTVETTTDPLPTTHARRNDRTLTGLRISTVRPLPAGDYTFVSEGRWGGWICRTQFTELERRLNRHTRTVQVTSPHGTVHEAFFDPVAIGAAVGADASNGVLEPAAFTVGGASATMTSLEWESSTVTMELNPSASLAGHAVDFIALDGSVSLTLSFDDATQSGGALTWSVASQPWQAGDLLMLRIRPTNVIITPPTATPTPTPTAAPTATPTATPTPAATPTPTPTPMATPTPTPTPTPTSTPTPTTTEPVTVTLIPRVDGLTFFDIDIQWSHGGTCDNYYVAIITDADYQISFLGFHPPETSSHYVEGSWLYDSVPDFWVVVECRTSGDSQEVGRASLRAAHPDNN